MTLTHDDRTGPDEATLAVVAEFESRRILQPHVAAVLTVQARQAGMSWPSARRCPQYLALKARRREEPITLAEAVAQCRAARVTA